MIIFQTQTKGVNNLMSCRHHIYLVWADAELEFVVPAGLHYDRVAGVQLRHVQVAGVLLVLWAEDGRLNWFKVFSLQWK